MKTHNHPFFVALLYPVIVLLTALPSPAQTPPQTVLELGKPLERTIRGSETHSFTFDVKAAHYARAEVEQKNIDVVVSLFAPGGKLVVEMDGKDGRLWREAVSCIAEKDGVYRVEITPYGLSDKVGSYTVRLAEMRLSKLLDRKRLEAEAHLSAGRRFYEQGEAKRFDASREYYAAAGLWHMLDEKEWLAVTVLNLGWTYYFQRKTEMSIEACKLAEQLFKKTKDRVGESKSLKWLGVIHYNHLRELAEAENYFEQTLAVQKEIKDLAGMGQTLTDLGLVSSDTQRYEKAQKYYEQALEVRRQLADRKGEGQTLSELGVLLFRLKEYVRADEYFKRALLISRETNDIRFEMKIQIDMSIFYSFYKEYENARACYDQALMLARQINDRGVEGIIYWNLFSLYSVHLTKPNIAVFYGKKAVDVYQGIFGANNNLDKNTLQVKIFQYRRLSDYLISLGRLSEARLVLDLLKGEEYEQLTRSGAKADTVPYSEAEASLIAKIENLVSLERERKDVQKLETRTSKQEAKLEQLRIDIAAANRAFDAALDALGKSESSASARVDEIKGEQEIQSALQSLGRETKSGIVALYTVLGFDEEKFVSPDSQVKKGMRNTSAPARSKFGWVIMVTDRSYKAYPIDVSNLNDLVFQFRDTLTSERYDPKPLAEKIYTAIFRQASPKLKRTLEDDLRDYLGSNKDKTLMWSLDGVLRYIPMSALHDGKQYLVENYRNVVFTKQSFLWLTKESQADWQALGLGVSEKRETFDALPGVKTELETIVREADRQTGIMNGSIKLNDNFKKQMFFNTVGNGTFPVVHIASHYSFNAAQQDASFLLLGDGRLTFSELKENKNLFGTVDLLTLSACDTGVSGNGKEAEGFAYLAQSLGAKSVIASLWKVSDAGTPELMVRFYKLKADNPRITKGEAFRQAQLSLLYADSTSSNQTAGGPRSEVVPTKGKNEELPLFVKDAKRPFAHPHYWASFVLIGNWR